MKTIDTTPIPWRETLKVSAIRIKSNQLVDLIKRHSDDSSQVVVSYKSGKNERTELEGLEEIEQYLASIKVPFSIRLPKFKVSFEGDSGAKFEFAPENRSEAENAYLELKQFKPWYAFVKHWFVYVCSMMFVFLMAFTDYLESALSYIGFSEETQQALIGIGSLFVVPIMIGNAILMKYSTRYVHTVNTSFLKKHGHEVVLVILSSALTFIATLAATKLF